MHRDSKIFRQYKCKEGYNKYISFSWSTKRKEGNSFIVYAIADSFGILRRNLGFAWEPGRFGSILSIGLLVNLFLNNFNLKNNKHFFIILGALLSSQSTTAYMAMIAVIVIYLYNKKVKYIILLLPIAIILIFYIGVFQQLLISQLFLNNY